jgi:hypothetical protein
MRAVCLSTLKPLKGPGYSSTARRNLWGRARVPWRLLFDRAALAQLAQGFKKWTGH